VLAQDHHGVGLTLEAWDRSSNKKIATGKISSIDNQIDTTTGTIKMRSAFDNKNLDLYPNEFVNTRLLVKTLQNQILLPSSAIQHNGDQAYVYVIENDHAKMQNVQTGVVEGGNTAVQGVNAGQVVIDSSFDKLQNNSQITISKQPLPSDSSLSNSI
jgi:membrane fusion protein, multidrug efflux system